MERKQTGPYAPLERFVIQDLPEETLVYDLESHQAHCLNRSAAVVWRRCDGKTSVEGLKRALRDETGAADAAVVEAALADLSEAGLIENFAATGAAADASRRDAMKRLAFAGAVAIPFVTTILAPRAVSAQSGAACIANGNPCSTDAECCSTCCDPNSTLCDVPTGTRDNCTAP